MGVEKVASELSGNLLNLYLQKRQFTRELAQRCDHESLRLLDLLEHIQRKWLEEVKKNTFLQDRVRTLETEVNKMRNEQLSSTEHLRHARAQIATLISEKDILKIERDSMSRDFQLVKDILKPEAFNLNVQEKKRIAFLETFVNITNSDPAVAVVAPLRKVEKPDEEEVDYDKAEEFVEQQALPLNSITNYHLGSVHACKRSHNQTTDGFTEEAECCYVKEVPAKRTKDSLVADEVRPLNSACSYRAEIGQVRRSINRSFSESDLLGAERHETVTSTTTNQLPQQIVASSVTDVRNTTHNLLLRSWTKGAAIENRAHTFSNYTSIIGDKCDICNRWIGLGSKPAFKCNDCNLHLHKVCVGRAPVPCVPHMPIPRTLGKQRPRLIDFCPSSRPLIPKLIIHCVLALENNYLNVDGLYRIPGQESQVLKLLNEFKNPRFQPKLRFCDPETITGCIKRFLAQLRDSLIPSSSFDEFVSAANQHNKIAIDRCINDLPAPHKDTLAFLCNHFQKVCSYSSVNKVTPEVLARSIAPTIVGRLPIRAINIAQGNEEAAKQTQVMLSLLDMPLKYWSRFYSCEKLSSKTLKIQPLKSIEKGSLAEQEHFHNSAAMSKLEVRALASGADQSLLGPIHTPPTGSNIKFAAAAAYSKKNINLMPF